jgi:hypothetical protein
VRETQASAAGRDPDKAEAVVASKLDAMAYEYNQLLTQVRETP